MFPAARRIWKAIKSGMSSKVTYTAPAEKNQSTLTDEQVRKLKNPSRPGRYTMPKTPKVSGIGWGP